MKYPLGFEIDTKIEGLSVSLEQIITPEKSDAKTSNLTEETDNMNLFNTLVMKSNIRNS